MLKIIIGHWTGKQPTGPGKTGVMSPVTPQIKTVVVLKTGLLREAAKKAFFSDNIFWPGH